MDINKISNEDLRDIFRTYAQLSNTKVLELIAKAQAFDYPDIDDVIFHVDNSTYRVFYKGLSRSLIVNRKLQTVKGDKMNIDNISNEDLRDIFKLYKSLDNNAILNLIEVSKAFGYPHEGDTIFYRDGTKMIVPSTGYSRSLIYQKNSQPILKAVNGDVCKTIRVKDVYGTNEVPIPYGYKATHFGVVKSGQTYLDLNGTIVCTGMPWGKDETPTIPRVAIIIEKVNDNS